MSVVFSDLPEDILIEIFSYLDVFSLFSVSRASPKLNKTLNINTLWKRSYKKSFGTYNFLQSEPNERQCKWKNHAFNKLKLYTKWKEGIYTEKKIVLSDEMYKAFCDDDIVIFIYNSTNFDVYDLKMNIFTQQILSVSNNFCINYASFKQGILIIVQGSLFQLYKKYGNTLKLERIILLDDFEIDIPDLNDLTDWYEQRRINNISSAYDHDSVYFVFVQWEAITTAIILNISNKTKKELILDESSEVIHTDVYLNQKIIYFVLKKEIGLIQTHIHAYDILNDEIFFHKIFEADTIVHVTENLIFTVTCPVDLVEIWDSRGNNIQRILLQNTENITNFIAPYSMYNHPYFIFSSSNLEKIQIINPSEELSTSIDRYSMSNTILVEPFLILISSRTANNDSIFDLWSLIDGHPQPSYMERPQPVDFHSGSSAIVTPSATNLILTNDYWCKNTDVIIKKFW